MVCSSCCAVALAQHSVWNCGFGQQAPEGVLLAAQQRNTLFCRATFFAAGEKNEENVARVFFIGGEKKIKAPFALVVLVVEKTF